MGLSPVRRRLANGATVIAVRSTATPAVTIHATVYAGTIFDPPGRPGVAHFVSRTIDRGTTTRTADAIAEDLDGRGVTLSTGVNRHALSLVATCLVEDFVDVLALIADCLMHPTFPDAEVQTRRGEIVTTIRQDEDNPAAVAAESLMSVLYGEEHPYGRRTRGTVASVEAIDRDALVRFHREQFTPSALALVLVGDVDPEVAIDVATEVLGGWRGGPRPEASLPSPAVATARRTLIRPMMSKSQADIAYGFTSILRSDPTYYASWLMNNIFGQYSIGGRLGDSIRERQGMAYYVLSSLDANVIPGPLMIRAGVDSGNVERAIASIDAEIRAIAEAGPTEKEVAESKQYLIGSLPRNLETNLGIANFLQTSEFFGLGLDYDERIPELLRAVTRAEAHAAARALLDPDRAAVVVAGPYEGALA